VDYANLSFDKVQLLVLNGQGEAVGRNAPATRRFIQAGGGVMIGGQAWWWSYSKPVAEHPNNKLIAPLGLILTGEAFESEFTFPVGEPPSQTSNAIVGVKCLADSCLGRTASTCYTEDTQKLANMMQGSTRAAEFAPTTSAFMTRLLAVSRQF
jgi:hypothetical protein